MTIAGIDISTMSNRLNEKPAKSKLPTGTFAGLNRCWRGVSGGDFSGPLLFHKQPDLLDQPMNRFEINPTPVGRGKMLGKLHKISMAQERGVVIEKARGQFHPPEMIE
jgi:hypothetical protein